MLTVEKNFEKEELMNKYREARKTKDYKKMLEIEAELVSKGY